MERIRQWILPGLLLGLLLLANLQGMGQEQKATTPTPAPTDEQSTTVTYPDLPGRIIFRSGDQLQLLEGRQVRPVPLPGSFRLPENAQSAFAPNGKWVAGFTRQGDLSILLAVDLTSGMVTRFGTVDPGGMRWSPDSQQIAVWSGSQLQIFSFGRGNFEVRGGDGVLVGKVAWAPDSRQLAVSFTPPNSDRSAIDVVDPLEPSRFQRVTEQGSAMFWAPNGEGLIFARYTQKEGMATELVLRKSDGREATLVTAGALLQANPEAAAIQGGSPHITSIQGDYNPETLLFTLKYYSNVNPRFAVGTLSLPGTPVQINLLPIHADHPQNQNQSPPRPCYPGALLPLEASLLVVVNGFGCEGLLQRMEHGSLALLKEAWTAPSGLVAPDGDYVLTQPIPGTMPTATPLGSGSSKMIPLYGEPILWDRG